MRGIVRIAKNRDENHVILLNENKSFVEQNYHGFHELTHILTVDEPGTTLNCFGNTRPNQNSYIEWLANEGAAEFLMPYKEILPIIRNESKTFDEHSMPIFDLSEKLSNMYNVSTVVVQNRISSLSYEIWQYLSGRTYMNNLQIFNNAQFGEIRTIDENGTVLFCGSDIAKALGYSNTKDALARHCKEDGVVFHDLIDNMGREQHAKFINEGNVYRLITHSKLPAAEQFESWVFDEVLPTIRRNGAYMTDDTLEYALTSPDFLIQLATKLKEEKAKRIELEAQVEQDKPKVLFARAVETAHTSMLIGDLAKILKQNGVQTGQKRLFEQLRQDGYLIKGGNSHNMPTQRAMEMGLFEVKESTVNNPDGSIRINRTTKVTGKGQTYFINKYMAV